MLAAGVLIHMEKKRSGSDYNPANDNDTCRRQTFPGIYADLADGGIFTDSLCGFMVYVEIVSPVFCPG